jgi:single-stranded-DNA-specific exonuclease
MDWETSGEITHISRPIEEILKARNVKDVDRFLKPKLSHLYLPEYDPFLMKDMTIGVARVAQAIEEDEIIMVEGDYDADGVTSTATFVLGLEEFGASVFYHVPKRQEGYGLSKASVDIADAKGATLIVTCDNGIAAVEAVDYAKSLGIDVVITDHHKAPEVLPNAFAIINPQQIDCPYESKELAGCGVVFKFLQAMHQFINGDSRKAEKYLDIVCIGTVGDVMKLVGENRVITKFGLERIVATENRGLQQLLRALSLDDKEEITVRHLGFNIVPCLNAAGRLRDASEAIEMLLTQSKRTAYRTARKLNELNNERRELTKIWADKIGEYINNTPSLLKQKVMIIPYDEDVPEGLIGIIAGRLKEKYQRPVILLSPTHKDPELYKGSGRSIFAYNMYEEILPYKYLTEGFGGQEMACGMTINKSKLKEFTKEINKQCTLTADDVIPKLFIDYEIEPELVTQEFVKELDMMKPFGQGNQQPLFMLRDVYVQYPKGIGQKGQHLKFLGQANEENVDMIGWSMYEKWEGLGKPDAMDVAFYPGLNTWNNKTTVQLELRDIRKAE